jgi:HD-GYP domain-containing protein (c-di-GMP phosphodiesterase class II)
MTTDRPYQQALSVAAAIEELRAGRGTQFAPVVVDAFLATLGRGTVRVGAQERVGELQAVG